MPIEFGFVMADFVSTVALFSRDVQSIQLDAIEQCERVETVVEGVTDNQLLCFRSKRREDR